MLLSQKKEKEIDLPTQFSYTFAHATEFLFFLALVDYRLTRHYSSFIKQRQLKVKGERGQEMIHSENNFNISVKSEGHFLKQKYIRKHTFQRRSYLWGKFTGTNMVWVHFWLHLDINHLSLSLSLSPLCSVGGLGLYRWCCSRPSQGVSGSGFGPLIKMCPYIA